MRKTLYRLVMTFLAAWLVLAGGAYAAALDGNTIPAFSEAFGLEREDYIFKDQAASTSSAQIMAGVDADLSGGLGSYGGFTLTRGFDKTSSVTFSSEKVLSGTGSQYTRVGILVYHFDASTYQRTATFRSIRTIGESGLYSEIIPLDHIGSNYVLVAVEEGGRVYNRLFKVVCKPEETKVLLENMQLDFLDRTPGQEPAKTGTSSLMDLLSGILSF